MVKTEDAQGVTLKLNAAIALEGQIVRAGQLIEVTQSEAKNLLNRGRAVLATDGRNAPDAEDAPADEAVAEKPAKAAK